MCVDRYKIKRNNKKKKKNNININYQLIWMQTHSRTHKLGKLENGKMRQTQLDIHLHMNKSHSKLIIKEQESERKEAAQRNEKRW